MGKKDKKKKAAKSAKLEKKLAKERKRLKKAEASNVEKPAKTAPPISPLAPAAGFPALPEIAGVRFASIAAGVRYSGRTDVMLVELAPGTAVAGVFTRSATRAAPVLDCQAKIGGPPTGRRDSRQRGQRQRLHRRGGPQRGGRSDGRCVSRPASAPTRGAGVHRVDRRDRRAAAARPDRGRRRWPTLAERLSPDGFEAAAGPS
jgi:hypothetical protein